MQFREPLLRGLRSVENWQKACSGEEPPLQEIVLSTGGILALIYFWRIPTSIERWRSADVSVEMADTARS